MLRIFERLFLAFNIIAPAELGSEKNKFLFPFTYICQTQNHENEEEDKNSFYRVFSKVHVELVGTN